MATASVVDKAILFWPCHSSPRFRITLNAPIIVSHNNFLKPMLIFIMRINMGCINYQSALNSSRKLAWAIVIVSLKNQCG